MTHEAIVAALYRMRLAGALPFRLLSAPPSGVNLEGVGIVGWVAAERIASGESWQDVLGPRIRRQAAAVETSRLRREYTVNRARERLVLRNAWRERHAECEARRAG